MFSIRGLRLYFPSLEPWFPPVGPGLSVRECGAAGSASGQTACPVGPTLRQSQSRHSNAIPLHPGCLSPRPLPVWMNVYFLSTWCRTSLPFDFPSVLVVRGGTVCLPTPPSWFSVQSSFLTSNLLFYTPTEFSITNTIVFISTIPN